MFTIHTIVTYHFVKSFHKRTFYVISQREFDHVFSIHQFKRIMLGDRFFFNHKKRKNLKGVGFIKMAREILQARTMSGVLCDTTGLTKVPSNVFQMNCKIIDCSETAKIGKAEIKKLIKFSK